MKRDNNLFIKNLLHYSLFFSLLITIACSPDAKTEGHEASNTTEENTASESATPPEAAVADQSKGVGPVSNVDLGTGIDKTLADQGKSIFESKCAACHKLNERYVAKEAGSHAYLMAITLDSGY